MTSSKSIGAWPIEAMLTIRAGAEPPAATAARA
jgi:hypothetical protein